MSTEKGDKVNKAIELMRLHGADIIDPVNVTGVDDKHITDDLTHLFRYTFRHDIANYLSELKNTSMRSIKDLIEFNIKHADQEFNHEYSPDQNMFISAENLTNFTANDYESLYNKCRERYGRNGIDAT
jgi:hypothetical protein